jgi:hypothetical protein
METNENPLGEVLLLVNQIDGFEKPIAFQDVIVKDCLTCPCNSDDYLCAMLDKTFSRQPRDDKNFPEFCPLNEKPVLIRRVK